MEIVKCPFEELKYYLRWAGIGRSKTAEITPWRIIYDYELIFVQRGEVEVEEENTSYLLTAGDLHVMPPNVKHKRIAKNNCKYYCFHFDILKHDDLPLKFDVREVYISPIVKSADKNVFIRKELLREKIYAIEEFDFPRKLHLQDASSILFCCKEAVRLFFKTDKVFEHAKNNFFCYFICCIGEEIFKKEEIIDINKQVKAFMIFSEKHIAEKIDIILFCKHIGYSYEYFRKVFQKATGESPQRYLEREKMQYADRCLRSGNYTVTAISNELDYSSPFYFSKRFKKIMGYVPSDSIFQKQKGEIK